MNGILAMLYKNHISCLLFLLAISLLLTTATQAFASDKVKAPKGKLNGIWIIEDTGNDNIDVLELALSHQYSGLGNRTEQSSVVGVGRIKYPGKPFFENASGKLNLAGDGTVTMAFGQFGFCNCLTVDYTVKPTGNPNIMRGEWKHRETSGATTWRRQPPIKINAVNYRLSSPNPKENYVRDNTFDLEEPLNIAQEHTIGNFWITILGDRLAGGHNMWVDDDGGNIMIRDIGWLCKNGEHREGGDSWKFCGSDRELGDGVVGIKFLVISKGPMPTGVRELWLDGQKISLNVFDTTLDTQETQSTVEIRILTPDLTPIDKDHISYGEPFVVQAVYSEKPDTVPDSVTLEWVGGNTVVRLHPSGEEGTAFASNTMHYVYDKRAILELGTAE
jgi:hypothetical protein